MSEKRIRREYIEFLSDAPENLSIFRPNENDIYHLIALIVGPPSTPYENGIYYLDLHFNSGYPFVPPTCKFITKIFHPNINENGSISLDILQDQWSPALTVRTTLLSIYNLMADPNPENPLVSEIAELYKSNIYKYYKTAYDYSVIFANAPDNHELYYLEGENRLTYELNDICYKTKDYNFIIKTMNNKYCWQVLFKIEFKDEYDKKEFVDFNLMMNFPQNYPCVPPEIKISDYKKVTSSELNKALKIIWKKKFLALDVLKWIHDCLKCNEIIGAIFKKRIMEKANNNLTYNLLKEKFKNN